MLILVASSVNLSAQSKVKGVVTDKSTGETLIGANVTIEGTVTGASTDFDGKYVIKGIKPGSYKLLVSYLGYEDKVTPISLAEGQVLELDFQLDYVNLSATEGTVITITAQAEGQIAAINKQLSSKSITNVISAKRIQEVPDANAAESVGRLPGVSIVRSGGEGAKVVVRGLAPKYNKVQIEGVSMASTGSDDRSSDLSSISPYMLEGIELTKAALPDQEANVLGGSINFVLRSAPNDPKLDALVQTGYNSLKDNTGDYKFILGGSRRFLDSKLGLFVQGDVEKRTRSSYDLDVVYFHQTNPPDAEDVDVSIDRILLQDIDRKLDRIGGVAVADYRLKGGSIKLSSFVSNVDRNNVNRFENLRSRFIDHTYTLTQKNSNLLIWNSALKVEKEFGSFTFEGGASRAFSENNTPKEVSLSGFEQGAFDTGGTIPNPDDPQKEIVYDLELPPDVLIQFARNDISSADISNLSETVTSTDQTEKALFANLSYDLTVNKDISVKFKTGVKFKELKKNFDRDVRFINIRFSRGVAIRNLIAENFPEYGLDPNPSMIPYQLITDKNYSLPGFPGDHYSINNIPDINIARTIADLANDNGAYDTNFPGSKKDDYFGTENYSAGYLMAEFNFGKSITFIPGVRYEKNTTEYNGIRGNSEALQAFDGYVFSDTTTTRSNDFILPMFHLKYKPFDWFDLRLAFTKTLNRPNFNRIVPSWNESQFAVAYNNPGLEASTSTNLDFYASFYNSKLGLFTVGGFRKNIKKLIYSSGTSQIIDPAVFGLPESDANKLIELFVNNKFPVKLTGIELEWQTRFWYLEDVPVLSFFKGVILNVNYTHTSSTVKYPQTIVESQFIPPATLIVENIDTFYQDRLILQPNDLFNLTIGYDYKGLSVRGSVLFQNDIFSGTNVLPRHRQTTGKFTKYDISLQQKLPVKGLELLLNLNNITSSAERVINQGTGYPVKEQSFGMTVDLGVRYRIQ
ncbi:MAG TPA: TonB-dependent receptor [Bacteroidetes bacterium]|nr:TonB-dependent receptor [Bacteroidota bacterium]